MDSIIFWILLLFSLWILLKRFVPVKGLRNLPLQQFKDEYKGNLLVDVREVHEYKQGHINGAVNIPLSQLHHRIGEIPRDCKVYLYCRSGMRSKQAAKLLSRNGHNELAHLNGGIMSWDGPIKK